MSKLLLSILIGASMLTAISVSAKPPSESDREEFKAIKMEQMKLKSQEKLLKLKLKLNLQDNQLRAWNSYEEHMQESAGKQMLMAKGLRQTYANKGTLPSSIDLANANIKRLEQKLALAKERLVIFTDLYNVLDEKQRADVDKLALRKIKKSAKEARNKRNRDEK